MIHKTVHRYSDPENDFINQKGNKFLFIETEKFESPIDIEELRKSNISDEKDTFVVSCQTNAEQLPFKDG